MALEPDCFAEILVLLFTSHMILDKLISSYLGFLTKLFWKLTEVNQANVNQCLAHVSTQCMLSHLAVSDSLRPHGL